jgi:hypothetical protein
MDRLALWLPALARKGYALAPLSAALEPAAVGR